MADLIVVVPSRGRPGAVAPLVDAFRETCATGTRIVLVVDADDPTRHEYAAAVEATLTEPEAVDITTYGQPDKTYLSRESAIGRLVVSHGTGMAEALNIAALPLVNEHYAIGFMGDDHRPRTFGWDAEYLKALRELGTGIVYGDDLVQRRNLPTQVAMTSDIIRTLGYMTPPGLGHMYLDNFWRDLGTAAGCLRYLPDVVVEHVHPVAGKAAWDEGYARVNDAAVYERDRTAYARYRATGFADDVVNVVALLRSRV
jgi:hypothetical protein